MSAKKIDRALHGPSWTEVILGAVLSLLLGVVIGAALLILRPVKAVRELPKEGERDASLVYFVEGSRDGAKGKQAMAKRKAFAEGKSVAVTEDEINSVIAGAAAPAAAPAAKAPEKKAGEKKAPEKAAEKTAAAAADMLAPGTPNFRIREGVVQIGLPVTIGLMGLDQKVMVHAKGGFAKDGETFAFVPTELYLGSCPVHRLPVVSAYVLKNFLASAPIPEDIAGAWRKLSGVAVEGNTLKLTMQ